MACVDPKTGDFVMRPKGKCPPGTVEAAKERVKAYGILWRDHRNKD